METAEAATAGTVDRGSAGAPDRVAKAAEEEAAAEEESSFKADAVNEEEEEEGEEEEKEGLFKANAVN